MRRWAAIAGFGLLTAGAAFAEEPQTVTFAPHDAYVAPERGLRVRAEPRADAPILATLWQGARVFVREDGTRFVRIDGYGVAGFAYVDRGHLSAEAPAAIAPAAADNPR
jgi:hypothetical protein